MGRKSENLKVIKKPVAGQMKEFTPTERAAARYMAGLFTMTKVMQAVAIAWFCGEEKYYRILGYTTEQEFIEMFAGKGYAQGKKFKEIGQSFLKLHPLEILNLEDGKGQLLAISDPSQFIQSFQKSSDLQKLAQFVEKIGIEKFYSLTQYDVDFKDLAENEAVVLKDGRRIPLDDVIATSNRELMARIEDLDGKLTEKKHELTAVKSKLEERARLAESERDRLRGIEEKYGPRAVKFEEKRHLLDLGRDAHRDSLEYLVRCNIEIDDGEQLVGDMAALLKEWDDDLRRLRDLYSHTILKVKG